MSMGHSSALTQVIFEFFDDLHVSLESACSHISKRVRTIKSTHIEIVFKDLIADFFFRIVCSVFVGILSTILARQSIIVYS